ncbi:MAG: DUF2470 domain-containing protein [Geminicoccaceae bacterium]
MNADTPGSTVRRLIRSIPRVALGTRLVADGQPYVSLAMVACDHAARPLLLLSDLADHTRNIKAHPYVSLLFDGTLGLEVPLTGSRASVQGKVTVSDDPADRQRYVARHPDAAQYIGFGDFRLYRVEVEKAHLVAGFGRIHWVDADAILYPADRSVSLAGHEADVVEHMNSDHADAVQLYARQLLGRDGDGWTLTGVDPEGADLRRAGETARLWFDKPVADAEECRVELVRLVKRARAVATGSPPAA